MYIIFLLIILLGLYMSYYSLKKLIKTKRIKSNGVKTDGIINAIISKASVLERRNYQPEITFTDITGNTISGHAQNVITTTFPIWNKVGQKVLVFYDTNNHSLFIIYSKTELIKALLVLASGIGFIYFGITNLI